MTITYASHIDEIQNDDDVFEHISQQSKVIPTILRESNHNCILKTY